MYPFMRHMGLLKGCVRNRHLSEGSIIEGYAAEVIEFFTIWPGYNLMTFLTTWSWDTWIEDSFSHDKQNKKKRHFFFVLEHMMVIEIVRTRPPSNRKIISSL